MHDPASAVEVLLPSGVLSSGPKATKPSSQSQPNFDRLAIHSASRTGGVSIERLTANTPASRFFVRRISHHGDVLTRSA
jgi:hypothetical protein